MTTNRNFTLLLTENKYMSTFILKSRAYYTKPSAFLDSLTKKVRPDYKMSVVFNT